MTGDFRVYDFCKPSDGNPGTFLYSKPLNDAFRANYVVLSTDYDGAQIPYYRTSPAFMSGGKWHALLYNHPAAPWEDVNQTNVADSGKHLRSDAWSLFETHSTPGLCTATPEFRSEN